MIERIDDCIEKLSTGLLSAIIPKCESIALELEDYDSWALLRLQSTQFGCASDVKIKYTELCKNKELSDKSIDNQFQSLIVKHYAHRSIEKDKVSIHSIYEIENITSTINSQIETLAIPEGLTPIDLYFENEKLRNSKQKIIFSLNENKKLYSQITALVSNILIELRLKAVELATHYAKTKPEYIKQLKHIFAGFHKIAKQLRSRHGNRNTLDIKDEYDVQDLLHALLRMYFDDIRAEEWVPSYAGRSSRMDFLLKNEKIVIEVKKTRETMKDKELGEQLIIDIDKYKAHPSCERLICFVYDPEGLIGNPKGIETDLNSAHNGFVEVIIKP